MNILFYLHQFPAFGGIETVTATWANYLAGEGHAVFIRSHISKETDCTALALASSVRADFMPDASRLVSPANRASLNARVAGSAIDVIVFQDSYARIEGNLADLWGRVPVLVYEHNAPLAPAPRRPPLRFSPRTLARWLLFPYRRRKYARADVLRRQFLYAACARYVLLSNRFFGEFRARAGLDDWRKLRALPNPVSPSLLSAAPVAAKEKLVLCAATLDCARKGQDLLLQAWEKIAPRVPDWRLAFAGDGPDRAKLEAYVRARRIPRVEFLGSVGDMKPLYVRASILAAPSRREGWGLVLHEAMSQGCVPVVFNSYSAVYDVVQEDVTGLIVPSFDVAAFGEAVARLVADPALRARMSEVGRAAVAGFAVAALAPALKRLLAEVTPRTPSDGPCGLIR